MSLLPTKSTPPTFRPESQTIFLYGPPKVGKSTFASNAESPIFFSTEAGLGNLNVHQLPIDSWDMFLGACGEIAQGKHAYKTVVIDTIDNLLDLCSMHVLKKFKVEHESELSHGKGWSFVKREFMRALTRLSMINIGLILISHSREKEEDARTGSYKKHTPTLQNSIFKAVSPMCDILLFCGFREIEKDGKPFEARIMKTQASKFHDGGDRTGRLPETLPLDYKAFAEALTKGQK